MGRCVDLIIHRFLVSLLISTLWAQTDLDKLVMKDGANLMIVGSEYLGDYSRTEGMIVYFKSFIKSGLAAV